MMIVRYCRSSMCMGDDVMRGIYTIQMPDNATLGDLIGVLLCGGSGNDWPIPQTSLIGWTVYSDIGRVADVSADHRVTGVIRTRLKRRLFGIFPLLVLALCL